jgi:hypothetical protein
MAYKIHQGKNSISSLSKEKRNAMTVHQDGADK